MLGARSAMFCSPHPYGIRSSPSRFFRALPMMSPAQIYVNSLRTEYLKVRCVTFKRVDWGKQKNTLTMHVIYLSKSGWNVLIREKWLSDTKVTCFLQGWSFNLPVLFIYGLIAEANMTLWPKAYGYTWLKKMGVHLFVKCIFTTEILLNLTHHTFK